MPRFSMLVADEMMQPFRAELPAGMQIAAVHVWGLDYLVEVDDANAPVTGDHEVLDPVFQKDYETDMVSVLNYGTPRLA